MDYGESEALILYQDLKADKLLIDDKKARNIAEHLEISCLGTLGLLILAKEKGAITNLRTPFYQFISNKRFYSKRILNAILSKYSEDYL